MDTVTTGDTAPVRRNGSHRQAPISGEKLNFLSFVGGQPVEQHKYRIVDNRASQEHIKMYFVTEQFYTIPSEGIFSLISTLFGQNVTTKKEDGQPSLLELHLADSHNNNNHNNFHRTRDEKKRRQG